MSQELDRGGGRRWSSSSKYVYLCCLRNRKLACKPGFQFPSKVKSEPGEVKWSEEEGNVLFRPPVEERNSICASLVEYLTSVCEQLLILNKRKMSLFISSSLILFVSSRLILCLIQFKSCKTEEIEIEEEEEDKEEGEPEKYNKIPLRAAVCDHE